MKPSFSMEEKSFFVQSETDPTVRLAHSVVIEDGLIMWGDQNGHERAFGIEDVQEEPSGSLVFHRDVEEGGGAYKLIPLTNEERLQLLELMNVQLEDVED